MKSLKKITISIFIALVAFIPFLKINAATPVKIYMFYGDGCPYCAAAEKYFETLKSDTSFAFELVKYEVWNDKDNAAKMEEVAKIFGDKLEGVPYIIIGDKTFPGYAESFNEQIKQKITDEYNSKSRYTKVAELLDGKKVESSNSDTTTIMIFAFIVLGVVGVMYFAKKNAN